MRPTTLLTALLITASVSVTIDNYSHSLFFQITAKRAAFVVTSSADEQARDEGNWSLSGLLDFLASTHDKTTDGDSNGNDAIPRRLFTFWRSEDDTIPAIVAACIASMRTQNPKWEITVMDYGHPGLELPPKQSTMMSPMMQSDWYRLVALAEYGGVWMDATMVASLPLGHGWPDMRSQTFQAFNCPDHDNMTRPDCIESFTFAAPPKNQMVIAWRDEFRTALTMGCEEYVSKNWDALDERGRAWTYLCVYGALQVAVAKNGTEEGMATYWSNGCNLPGGLCGPYWSPTTASDRINGVFTASGAVLSKVPLIKFTSGDRSFLIDHPSIWRNTGGSHLGGILDDALEKLGPVAR